MKLVLCVMALTGCYSYLPPNGPEPQVGSRVSADLTDGGTDSLSRYLGPGVISIQGRVLGTEDRSLLLAVNSVKNKYDQEVSWRGEAVRIPPGLIAGYQQRRFSLGRSLLMGTAAAAASVFAWEAFRGSRSGGGGGRGGGPGSR
jgi:hypothetical protein